MELLAPAGGMAQVKAAVQSGADAVYLGAGSFSARAGAENFDSEQLKAAVDYCHLYNVKVHCALNTLIKESEFSAALETAAEINRCGVDAIIIQDIGLASVIKKAMPDIELHGSTQMTVTSLEGVRYLEEKGFSRVVLARELSYEEIKYITAHAKAEIEVFVHGAICQCYSGQCLMSSVLGGRSGNRGRCAQPCRQKYDLLENGKSCADAYALSPKDMALIDHLKELRKAGVSSLKIEGRLKSPEYVSAVTGIYRKYIDHTVKVSDEDMQELKNAFSRSGFTDGYFTGKTGREMMSHKNPANNSGSTYTDKAKERAAGKFIRKIPVNIFASVTDGDVLRVTMYDDDENYVSCEGDVRAVKADHSPLTSERLSEQLCRLGSTAFECREINVEIDDGITIPVKEINNVRRMACEELARARSKRDEKRIGDALYMQGTGADPDEVYLTAQVQNIEQGRAVLNAGGVRRIFAPADVARQLQNESETVEIVTKTADIFEKEHIYTKSVSVSSPAALLYYGDKAQYGDFRLNIYNSMTASEFSKLSCITLSPELNLREIAELTDHFSETETEMIGYGHIPVMIMRNCPVKALGKCQNGKLIYSLKDRKNMEFKVMCHKGANGCKAILLNSLPIFTADIIDDLKKTKINSIRLNFTVENSVQCGKIVNVYKSALNGEAVPKMAENTFTRGHLKRGVL